MEINNVYYMDMEKRKLFCHTMEKELSLPKSSPIKTNSCAFPPKKKRIKTFIGAL